MNTQEAVKSLQEYVNVPIAELTESGTNVRGLMKGVWRNSPKASAAKGCSRRSWCGERTIISKSSREQDALEPRR